MKRFFQVGLFALIVNSVQLLGGFDFENQKKHQMIQDLEVIKHHFQTVYAPADWKKDYNGWDLDKAFEQSKAEILSIPAITTKQFHGIVRNFLNTMGDYHVDALFSSTEMASLPFSVRTVNQRVFVDWIDDVRLPYTKYGMECGDELLEFDGQPILDVLGKLKQWIGKSSNPQTDQSLVDIKLTQRYGREGDEVPKGALLIKTKSARTGKIGSFQIHWTYMPEYVANPWDFLQCAIVPKFIEKSIRKQLSGLISETMMANPLHFAAANELQQRGLGSQNSFIPPLGSLLWEIDRSPGDSPLNLCIENPSWYAYIYEHPNRSKVGYLRIPNYVDNDLAELREIIFFLEKWTDALVIDQVNNSGGGVHDVYSIAAMLATAPMVTPRHRIKITQKDALKSYYTLQAIEWMEQAIQNYYEEEDEPEISYQELLFFKAYHECIISDWNKGKALTDPTHILGTDMINPNPLCSYTKPILILINELDFSGGDFLPAILQDNRRAVLFGSRTAGAGGIVRRFEFPNSNGIASCSYTASIAERCDSNKIEDLGVTPDIPYEITVEDLTDEYSGYVKAVNKAVAGLIH